MSLTNRPKCFRACIAQNKALVGIAHRFQSVRNFKKISWDIEEQNS